MTAVTSGTDVTDMTRMRRENSAVETLERTLNQAIGSVRADAVFGRPVEKGTTTVIPCAEVMVGLGLGGGSGKTPAAEQISEGEGYGGGAGGRGRPVAVIIVGQDGVQVRPVIDVTRLALAGMTTAGFMAFWLARFVAGGRGAKRSGASFGKLSKALRS